MHTDAPWQCHINLQVDSYGLAQPDLKGAAVPAGGGARPGLEGPRLVMRDALHLFSPGARHHDVLATEGTASSSSGGLLTSAAVKNNVPGVRFPLGRRCCSDYHMRTNTS